ncbi:MAG: hypothetical protein KGI09_04210 [Thaumarchaeota archaeon]|nr:hypothetical protein [Nitrososphaerota archaeon]
MMFRSLFLSIATRTIGRRTSFMPLRVSFPTIGFTMTTLSAIIGFSI